MLHIYCDGYELPRVRHALQVTPFTAAEARYCLLSNSEFVSHVADDRDAYHMSASVGQIIPLGKDQLGTDVPRIGDTILLARLVYVPDDGSFNMIWTLIEVEEAP